MSHYIRQVQGKDVMLEIKPVALSESHVGVRISLIGC